MGSKRKATAQLTGPSRPSPQSTTPAHLQTIDTLESIACTIPITIMTAANLPTAFPALTIAQQHLDLWAIFQSPNFKHDTPTARYHQTWMDIRGVTVADLVEWKHGPQANSLPHVKPSGAKLATGAVKRFRKLQTEAALGDSEGLIRALWMKELDYLLLMLATQLHNVNNMIPGHEARINELVSLLRPNRDAPTSVQPEKSTCSQTSEGKDEGYSIAMTFKQPSAVNLPVVVGHDDLARKIGQQILIPTLFSHLLEQRDRLGAQTFLLFGPPGTGKTFFAQSLAKEHDMAFFKVDNAALTSKFVGDTEKIIKALTDIAMVNKPSLIFFDEIEGITRERQGAESGFDRRFKNRLLEMFNDLNDTPSVIIVGATNRPWEIDEAFLNRFQEKVFFDLPRREHHMKMLTDYLKGKRAEVAEYEKDLLCTRMENYSGREVTKSLRELHTKMFTELMNSTSFVSVEIDGATYYEPCVEPHDTQRIDRPFHDWPLESLRPRAITWRDVKAALEAIKPTITEESLKKYQEWSSKFGVNSV